jgi:hypothetical protein
VERKELMKGKYYLFEVISEKNPKMDIMDKIQK